MKKSRKTNQAILIIGILVIVAIPVVVLINNMSGGLFSACRYSQFTFMEVANVKTSYIKLDGRGINTELVIEQLSGSPYIVDIYPGKTEKEAYRFIDATNQNQTLQNNVQVNYVVNAFLGRPKNIISITLSNKEKFDFCK